MSKPLVLLLCVLLPSVLSYDWKIGGLSYGSWGSNYTAQDDPFNIAQFMHLAILYVNNYTNMLSPYNITMKMEFYDVQGSTTQGVIKAFHLAETYKVRGVAGGVFSTEVIAEAQVLQYFEVPQTSGIASSTLLSDKTLYPYFFRVGPEDTYETISVLATLKQIGFTQAVLVYSTDDYGISCRTAFLAKASSYGVKAVAIPIATDVTTVGEYRTILQLIKDTNINVIVMYTQAAQGNSLIIQANATGMIGEKYSYFLSSTLANQFITHSPGNADPSLLDGMIGIAFASGSGSVYEDVKSVWDSLDPNLWHGSGGTADPGFPAWYSFDSVYVFALGLRNLLAKGYTVETITGKLYKDTLFALHELGTTNDIIFNENGDRLAYFDIYNWKNKGLNPTRVGLIDPSANYTSREQITFYGGSTTVPSNVNFVCSSCIHGQCVINVGCVCEDGWKGSSCDVEQTDFKKTLVWLIPVIVVFIIILLGGVYYWYHKKRRAFVKDVSERQRSQIERQDLIFKERIGRGASGEVTKAIYRGTDVAVKRIIASHASKSAIEEFELEVAIMCGLRHPNIILFMGSCYDPVGGEMLLVMELMTRGSLNDVLNNPKIPLAYDMLLHLATQAAQGMNFLHQSNPPIIHHDLKSHNILLDDKWNARISDFGITRFKENNNKSQKESKALGTIYWSAPELLAGDAISEKIDCYAFGIVLWEIFHRQNPYAGRDPMSVAIDVLHKDYRPSISYNVAPEIRSLITACWSPKPNDRPSFQQIMTTLRGLTVLAPVQSYETSSAVRVDAPSGLVYLVSTDIIGAYQLWDVVPKAMESSIKLHTQVLRTNMENYKGYEVSYDEHSFVIAFSTIEDASNFCIATQISLLNVSWPTEILAHPAARLEIKNGVCIWKGLRVRMSIVSGVPNCAIDPSSGRMNYFGPVVDKVGKLLSLQYNTVLLSDSFADEFNKKYSTMKLIQPATINRIGDILVTARDKTENIYQLVIDALSQRNSGKPDEAATPLPHMVISVHEYEETLGEVQAPKQDTITKSIDWIAKNDDITNRSPIGKGGIGDYFRASWKGKEVALKVLVNQKLKEDDMLRLVCDSSMMRKMNHPNVLPFYAICVEPNHITILSEYEALGSLKAVLADNTIQLPFAKKAKMMLDLAQGMQYISTHPDPTMRMHDNLKSNNVLVSKNWEVKVADYGHSNIRELARTLTSVGNIAWTAPEILQGEKATVKISQYSFGIIMWETYTRQVPYVDEHPIKTVSKILNGYRPPFPVDCPTIYSSLMQKCLANTPEERPAWEEIIQTLSSIN